MKKPILTTTLYLACLLSARGQMLQEPESHGVFGGRVLGIAAAQVGTDSVLLYMSCESANSMYYAQMNRYSGFAGPVLSQSDLESLPSVNIDDQYGSGIQTIDAHNTSGNVYFIADQKLYTSHPSYASAILIDEQVQSFLIEGDHLIYVRNASSMGNMWLKFGTLDASGAFTESASSPRVMAWSYSHPPRMLIDPTTNYLHLFIQGTSPSLQVVMDPYSAMSSSSPITSAIYPAPTSSPHIEWLAYGVAPDGRRFLAGGPVPGSGPTYDKQIAYTDDNGVSWSVFDFAVPGPPGGIPGNNFAFTNSTSSGYTVYNGAWYSSNSGISGSWGEIGQYAVKKGNKGNSGPVLADPIFDEIVYLTTNVGLGYSYPNADTIHDFNQGFNVAVVHDMHFSANNEVGYVASKTGIHRVMDVYTGVDSAVWRELVFPTNDGSPYHSVSFVDTQTVLVGNKAIYKTTNGGATANDWSEKFDPTLDGAWGHIYGYPREYAKVQALRMNPWNANEVFAGYNRTDGFGKGGLFISEDEGETWSQHLLDASSLGSDVNVMALEWAVDYTGDTVCFAALEYDAAAHTGEGIYRLYKSGGVWTHNQEVSLLYDFKDLQLSQSSDSVLALAWDGSEAVVYFRSLSSPVWGSLGSTGITDIPSALAVGLGYLFLAADNHIYMFDLNAPGLGWWLAYTYPYGTQIYTMHYDDLLVGTNTGLYEHKLDMSRTPCRNWNLQDSAVGDYKVYLSWDAIPFALNHRIEWRKEGETTWNAVSRRTNNRTLSNLDPGIYEWRVYGLPLGDTSCVATFEVLCPRLSYSVFMVPSTEMGRGASVIYSGISGGKPLYNISLLSPAGDTTTILNRRIARFSNLPSGPYLAHIEDQKGCFEIDSLVVSELDTAYIPELVSVTRFGIGTYRATWTPVWSATHYFLQVWDETNNVLYNTYNTSSITYDVTGLPSGRRYRFNVRSVYSDGFGIRYSAFSNRIVRFVPLVVSKQGEDLASGFNFYPNPAASHLMLELSEGTQIELLDLSGRVLQSAGFEAGLHSWNLDNHAAGMYILRAGNQHESQTFRLIIE